MYVRQITRPTWSGRRGHSRGEDGLQRRRQRGRHLEPLQLVGDELAGHAELVAVHLAVGVVVGEAPMGSSTDMVRLRRRHEAS